MLKQSIFKMRFTFKHTLVLLVLSSSFVSFSQCGATAVDPTPQISGICEGSSQIVDFASVGTCAGSYEYQVEDDGGVVVSPWSTTLNYVAAPTGTTVYTVFSRCSACPTTVVSDTFLVEVINQPSIVADTFVCYGTAASMTATGPAGTLSWWDAASGGTQLSPNENYTSPPMTMDEIYYVHATGVVTGGTNQGSILITECGLEGFPGSSSADYIEVSNLYSTPVNTSGWVVAISNSYTNINTVNSILWQLPGSFTPCSILSRTDVSTQPNYWGNNMFWNATSKSWAIIVDDVGNVVDFLAWGWTAAELAGFNANINGFNVTLGPEWIGNGCNLPCQTTGGIAYSYSRTGSADNNTAADFTCQATSLNVLNPALTCGWVSSNITCPYPVDVVVDMPPTASNPANISVTCYADVPVADPAVVIDELDDHTATPTVQFLSETSSGTTCPEILTRTYRVLDSCSNYVDVSHTITINDDIAPVLDPAPADLNVACYADVPVATDLNWTDNCDGVGSVGLVEVSSGTTCPEILTRTWTYTDGCGNTATETQLITINDDIAPVLDAAPANLSVQCDSDVPAIVSLNWTDNCDGSGSVAGSEVSDGMSCPETITRTWTYTDGCGNTATRTQTIVINDITAPTASPLPTVQTVALPAPDVSLINDAADNCGSVYVNWVNDVSDQGFCPEIITRTYSITDDCGNETLIQQLFTIGDGIPDVSFIATPTLLSNLESGLVEFTNTTSGAVYYEWDFNDLLPISNEVNPTHEFENDETAGYAVQLKGYSEFGCVDSFMVVISVREELLYFVPNTFTPDGDEYNQVFLPVFESGFDVHDYHMMVFNRWGEVVFESFDHTVGWDGTYNGKIVQAGSYIWRIEFGLEYTDGREIISGHVSLMK